MRFFRIIVICISLVGFISCTSKQSKYIVISNPSDMDRAEVVSIDYATISSNFGNDTVFRLVERGSGKELPYQFEKLGGQDVKNLLVWVELAAGESIEIAVEKAAAAPVEARTYARYVPERKDDFAWENDKVAFRMYGKALEDFPAENAHGTDVWAKRTPKLVVNDWYGTGDYHKDHGDGLDYYAVGLTLGAGDIAPFVGDEIRFPKHYRQHEVLDNGPLRSTFKLIYEPWDIDGKEVSAEKTISIDAGSQLNKVQAVFRFDGEETLPLVAGIVLRGDEGHTVADEGNGIAAYWEPAHGDDGTLGIAVLSEKPVERIFKSEGQLLSLYEAKNGEATVYYKGAAWDKAGEITSSKDWQAYLERFALARKHPLEIKLK